MNKGEKCKKGWIKNLMKITERIGDGLKVYDFILWFIFKPNLEIIV